MQRVIKAKIYWGSKVHFKIDKRGQCTHINQFYIIRETSPKAKKEQNKTKQQTKNIGHALYCLFDIFVTDICSGRS